MTKLQVHQRHLRPFGEAQAQPVHSFGEAQTVDFDYDHYMRLDKQLQRVHTIISVHRFRPHTKQVSQFYILSGAFCFAISLLECSFA